MNGNPTACVQPPSPFPAVRPLLTQLHVPGLQVPVLLQPEACVRVQQRADGTGVQGGGAGRA